MLETLELKSAVLEILHDVFVRFWLVQLQPPGGAHFESILDTNMKKERVSVNLNILFREEFLEILTFSSNTRLLFFNKINALGCTVLLLDWMPENDLFTRKIIFKINLFKLILTVYFVSLCPVYPQTRLTLGLRYKTCSLHPP